jgi:hypothetical protein
MASQNDTTRLTIGDFHHNFERAKKEISFNSIMPLSNSKKLYFKPNFLLYPCLAKFAWKIKINNWVFSGILWRI